MAPSALTQIRTWVGSLPDDTTLMLALGDHGENVEATALTVLRTRYADMVANPAKWSVVDDYSQDTSANLGRLAAQIRELEELTGDTRTASGFTSTPICGPGLGR